MWPRQIPPDVLRNPRRSTEIVVYGKLERELDDDWWVFYSRPWLGLTATGGEKDGECDFVVAHAKHGVLFIEVKGGAVAWNPETDQWTSRDRDGITHNIKDPVAQARTCKHELRKKLKKQRGFEHRFFVMRHGVVLPECRNPGHDLGPDRPLRIFCFSDTFPRQLADWVAGRFQQRDGDDDARDAPLGVDGLHGLKDLLARPVQLEMCLGAVVRAEDREINYLTQQQFHLLEAISELPRVLITGGAGTGKTVMAGRLAQDLAAAGKRTLLVCYNRPLAERLAKQAEDVAGLTVRSFHQLCLSVIAQAGGSAPADSGARQTYFDETLPAAAEACASSDAVEKFDAIIVDEGQDFRELWWLVIETLLKQDGQLRVFADNNQRVYGDVGRLKRDLQLAPISLTWNLRNTKAIHEAAYRHYQGAPVRCDGPAGEAPQLVEVADRSRVAGEVSKLVQSLTKQHDIAAQDVAVLVPNEDWCQELSRGGRLAGLEVTEAAVRKEGCVVVDTVRRFKGLESLVTIVVVDAELAANEELAYVVLSRARTRTYVVGQSRHLNTVLASEEG
jgi:predicted ATPase